MTEVVQWRSLDYILDSGIVSNCVHLWTKAASFQRNKYFALHIVFLHFDCYLMHRLLSLICHVEEVIQWHLFHIPLLIFFLPFTRRSLCGLTSILLRSIILPHKTKTRRRLENCFLLWIEWVFVLYWRVKMNVCCVILFVEFLVKDK